jgi:putative oxidoreductase
MRNTITFIARTILGGYLAVHGAQKLFGVFGGPGLDAAGAGFESMGLQPGKPMAALAGASELGGGILTIAGLADPLGPIAIVGSMAVASAVHRNAGPLAAKGGFELPLTNLALAGLLGASGPGRFSLGRKFPTVLTVAALATTAALSAVSIVRLVTHKPAPIAAVEPDADFDASSLAVD